jgi:hypothetical protein
MKAKSFPHLHSYIISHNLSMRENEGVESIVVNGKLM